MVEENLNRRLAAILMADVVGYSHLMEADEVGTLRAVKQHRVDVIEPAIANNKGRLVKFMGDGTLVEFASVLDAVNCATEIQQQTAARYVEPASDCRIELRIGINLGDVIVDGEDIYGEGVNVAARLESLAEPGGICLSSSVHDAIGNKLSLRCEFLGEHQVKNLVKPVRSYRVLGDQRACSPPPQRTETGPFSTFRPTSEPTLAVKPFEPLGSDADGKDFTFCLTNGVIVALNRMPGLTVVQDESPSFQHAEKMSAEDLGKRFAVRFLLNGQVYKLGSRIRVNAELIEVSSRRILWADKLDRELQDFGDFFAIQDEITEEIVTALDIKLLRGEIARVTRKVLKSPEAHECLYNGERMLWKAANKLELREAQRLLEEITRLEPTVSIGYAEAALAHWAAAFFGMSDDPSQSLAKAVELARRAIELDDVTGYSHVILAQVHLQNREFDEAKAEADQAVSDRPSCPAAFAIKAGVLNYLGDAGDAIEHAQHAVRLSPVYPLFFPAVLASSYHGAERYEEAIAAARDAIQLDPSKPEPYVILAACAVAVGHVEEAQQSVQKVLTLKPEFNLAAFARSQPYKDQKHLDRLLDQLGSAGFE